LRDALENFLIISPGGSIKWFHMSGERKPLGTNISRTLGSTIIGPRGVHKNHVINSYSHKTDSYNLAQGSYSWIQCDSII
jgi:hypothetical protein